MSDLTVAGTFTKNGGQPATGLALADIAIYLSSQHRATGAVAAIWATQAPTAEVTNVGGYFRIYTSADLDTYNYYAAFNYTGATVLDSDWLVGAVSLNNIPVGSAIEWTYPVTDSITGAGIPGVEVWFYTDAGATNLAWFGTTDVNGVARDIYNNLPRLNPGTYYVKVKRQGYLPDETLDVEVVS